MTLLSLGTFALKRSLSLDGRQKEMVELGKGPTQQVVTFVSVTPYFTSYSYDLVSPWILIVSYVLFESVDIILLCLYF